MPGIFRKIYEPNFGRSRSPRPATGAHVVCRALLPRRSVPEIFRKVDEPNFGRSRIIPGPATGVHVVWRAIAAAACPNFPEKSTSLTFASAGSMASPVPVARTPTEAIQKSKLLATISAGGSVIFEEIGSLTEEVFARDSKRKQET